MRDASALTDNEDVLFGVRMIIVVGAGTLEIFWQGAVWNSGRSECCRLETEFLLQEMSGVTFKAFN